MTSTHEQPTRIRRIGEERVAAQAMTEGPARDAAMLHVNMLVYIRDCQTLRDTGVSKDCAELEAMHGGVPNPRRPFLAWECCDAHRALKARREDLDAAAHELHIEFAPDMTQVIED